ncbi:MAG: Hpt domain-containing protein [Filomicrobium sp.]
MSVEAVAADFARIGNLEPVAIEGEVLDLAHLGNYTLGDEALKREILDLFREQIKNSLHRLQEAADTGDESAWQMAAHTLKGSARAVGAFRLGSAAAAGERYADSCDGRLMALGTIALVAQETYSAVG